MPDNRLADDERLELLLVGGSFERNLEEAGSSGSGGSNSSRSSKLREKLLSRPPASFSAGADLIKVTSCPEP